MESREYSSGALSPESKSDLWSLSLEMIGRWGSGWYSSHEEHWCRNRAEGHARNRMKMDQERAIDHHEQLYYFRKNAMPPI